MNCRFTSPGDSARPRGYRKDSIMSDLIAFAVENFKELLSGLGAAIVVLFIIVLINEEGGNKHD